VDEEPSRLPELSHAGEEDEPGRGLFLVEAVTDPARSTGTGRE